MDEEEMSQDKEEFLATQEKEEVDFSDEYLKEENSKTKNIDRDDEAEKKVKNKVNYGKEIAQMIVYFFVVICSVLLIHQFVGQQIEVSGSSMESTLHNKDHLILEKVTYEIDKPSRFDIIVFRPYETDKNLYYIKRIIGLPGETVQIIGSDIYINGEVLKEDYGKDPMADPGIASEKIVLAKDEYFLLGDNRNNSKDSRDSSIGAVKRSAILGRAWVRLWPLNSVGVLEHQ